MNFKGKVVLITGASSGIGAASAKIFAKHGAQLSLVGRNEERLQTIRDVCKILSGLDPLCFKLDLTKKGSCEKIVFETAQAFGKIDILINSAGIFVMRCLFDDTMDPFDVMIDINLRVPYKMTQLCIPYLKKTKGNVVNLSLSDSYKDRQGGFPHAVAKAALDKFTKLAACELACEGVRVNTVFPGCTLTNIMSSMAFSDEEVKEMFDEMERGSMKVFEPEDVAKMVVFVASGRLPNINGSELYNK